MDVSTSEGKGRPMLALIGGLSEKLKASSTGRRENTRRGIFG